VAALFISLFKLFFRTSVIQMKRRPFTHAYVGQTARDGKNEKINQKK
jgi:hypothetical protein